MTTRRALWALGCVLATCPVAGAADAPASVDAPAVTSAAPARDSAAKLQGGNPLWGVPLRQLSATRERPLFAPSRRPPPPPVAAIVAPKIAPPAPKPAEPEKPQLALVGTIAGEGESIGVFVDQAARAVVRLKTGENHNGWVLRGVQKREVTLEKGREKAVLALPEPDQKRSGPGSPALFGTGALQAAHGGPRRGPVPPVSPEDAPDQPDAAELAAGFNPYQTPGMGH